MTATAFIAIIMLAITAIGAIGAWISDRITNQR